jgi:iron complex outermembrane receptor protein
MRSALRPERILLGLALTLALGWPARAQAQGFASASPAVLLSAAAESLAASPATLDSLLLASAVSDSSLQRALAGSDSFAFVAPVMEVRGRRLSRQEVLDRAGGFSNVIHSSSWAGGIESAASVLSEATGVTVREAGGIGSYSTVSLRGSSAAQVPIYLDGVPLATPETGEVNLADIPLGSLERIEVYRGAAPLILGGASLGGAIHLVSTHQPEAPWLKAGAGSYSTYTFEGGGGKRWDTWSVGMRGRYLTSQGNWTYPFDNRTPYNPRDDFEAERVNNDVTGAGGILTARGRAGSWAVGISEVLDGREQGIPGRDLQSGEARGSSFTHQLRLAFTPLQREKLVRSAELFHRYDRQGFDDRQGELGLGMVERTDRVQSVGGALVGAFRATSEDAWRLEGRWAELRSSTQFPTEEEGPPQSRWTAAGAIQPTFRLARDRLAIVPGVRVEAHHDRFHGTPPFGNYELPEGPASEGTTWANTYQIGARWVVDAGLVLKANLGSHDRVPTLFERFGNRGTVIGNPDLRVETGINRDIGFVWSRPGESRRLAVSLFHNDSTDLIAFVRNSQQTARAVNIGVAEVKGVEVDLDLGQAGVLRHGVRFTGLSTEDRSPEKAFQGNPLPGRPGYEFNWRLDVVRPSWQLGYQLVALGSSTMERHGRTRIPSRTLHNLRATLLISRWALDLRVENLLDVRTNFDLYGWPLPGRQVALSLRTGAF